MREECDDFLGQIKYFGSNVGFNLFPLMSTSTMFVGTPLSIMLLDWNLVCRSTKLVEEIISTLYGCLI